MNRTFKLSLFCAGIFACGVVAGGLGVCKFVKPHTAPQPPRQGGQPGPGGPQQEGFGPQQLTRLSKELELTETQRAEILPLLEKAGDELRQLRRESFKQSSVIIEAMEKAVSERLTPEQKKKLEVLQEEQRARMKARMDERNRRKAEGGGDRRDGDNPERRPDEGLPPPHPQTPSPDAPAKS